MLVDNQILTYDDYKALDKESVYLLDRITSTRATTKLKNHHAKRVNDALEWISFLEESGKTAMSDDPTKWIKRDFERWKRKGMPTGSTAVPSTTATGNNSALTLTTVAEKQLKTDDNKLQSWIKGTKSAKDCPVIEHDEYYTKWIVKMNRQITLDMWERLIGPTFDIKTLCPGADKELCTVQCVFMSTVLKKVLLNTHGLKLVRLFEDGPSTIWRKHEKHQTSSSSSQRIAIVLSNRISNMTIATSKSRLDFLEDFDQTVTKFDKVSADKMPESQKIGLLC